MSSGFTRLAGWCAVITGGAALAYSITFAVVVQNGDRWAEWTSTLLLTAGALSGLPCWSHCSLAPGRPTRASPGWACLSAPWRPRARCSTARSTWAYWPTSPPKHGRTRTPRIRGFATFLLAGMTLALFSSLLGRVGAPRGLVRLGWATAVLLAWVWVGRLTALNPKEPWVAPAVVGAGFIGVPLWYVWLGATFVRGGPATAPAEPAASPIESSLPLS